MKTKTLNVIFFLMVSIGTFFFTGCEKEVMVTDDTSVESAQKSAEIDVISDNVSVIVEEAFITEEGITSRSLESYETFLPPCMTRTVEVSGMIRTVTLDFGDGCDMPNGNHLSGIITIVYERNPSALTRTITYSFTDFYFNNKNIEGGGSIFREWANDNGNPQSTKNQNITVTWPNAATAHRVGVKVREWVAGVGSGTWGDNVFLITGNWTTEFPNGDVNSGIVTTPLRRELACRFIVSGEIALSHNEMAGTLNFGEGDCDNIAIFTAADGTEHTIVLD
jgi:hypothetical protein